jgi:hypothetical protein
MGGRLHNGKGITKGVEAPPHNSVECEPSSCAQEAAMAVKVFVFSTYIDLKDHRQRVIAQLRRAGALWGVLPALRLKAQED